MNDDIFILNLIRQGDELAFKSLFDRYFVPLCRFMNIYLQDKKKGKTWPWTYSLTFGKIVRQYRYKYLSKPIFSNLHVIVVSTLCATKRLIRLLTS